MGPLVNHFTQLRHQGLSVCLIPNLLPSLSLYRAISMFKTLLLVCVEISNVV